MAKSLPAGATSEGLAVDVFLRAAPEPPGEPGGHDGTVARGCSSWEDDEPTPQPSISSNLERPRIRCPGGRQRQPRRCARGMLSGRTSSSSTSGCPTAMGRP